MIVSFGFKEVRQVAVRQASSFFEKKEAKKLFSLGLGVDAGGSQMDKSFFGSFFSKKELLACLALFSAAPALAQELPQLRVAMSQDADALDPTLSRAYVQRVATLNMCDGLFTYNDKLALVNRLAVGYEWADSKTLTVKLRPGVVFHDGTPFDAAAVKYSTERHATMPGTARKGDLASLDHVEVVDPLTVRFVLKQPDVVFLSQLAVRAGVPVSPKAAEAAGKDFALNPVCAGPYKFVERVAQDRIVIDRVPDYWDAANYHFSRVTFRPITDSTVRMANLRAGAVDVNIEIPPVEMENVRKDPKLRLVPFDGLGYSGITFNLGRNANGQTPLGMDKRVRQAFELAIDRQALVDVVYAGAHAITAQPLPPTSPFYIPAVKPTTRDPAKARALLAEAGVKTPFVINLTVINQPDQVQLGEVIQSMAAEAGFDVKIQSMEFVASLDAAEKGSTSAYLVGWTGRPDADGNIRDLLHTGAPVNWGGYKSEVFDKLIDDARSTADMPQRLGYYGRAFAQLHEDLPILYLYAPRWIFGMSSKIEGFAPVADGMLRLSGVSMSK
jgi:peptide/nickel transport system substrate-binding protein